MRIGIDMRMAGTGEGIGRYVEELVKYLSNIDFENDYVLLFDANTSLSSKFKIQNSKFRNVDVHSKYYSWAEQTRFVWELNRLKLDLMHFTNFNFPILYRGRFVTTIHDIIHHLYPGKKKSRFFHRLAYRLTIKSAVKRAARVIAVSSATKNDIIQSFKVIPEKVKVIYEGVDPVFSRRLPDSEIMSVKEKYGITRPYLLFVGVWRQYKNLPNLARTFDILKEQYMNFELVLAGKIDPFYPEIKAAVFSAKHASDIKALGFVPDNDLPALFQGAEVFVLPSLVEGFGLIGVEAQGAGTPVAASAIPVLREVLGEAAEYFDPRNPRDMAEKIGAILANRKKRESLIRQGKENAEKYDWQQTAAETAWVYREALA